VRGGTHATIIRKKSVRDIEIPDDIEVMEDQYIRKHIEDKRNYLWTFNHQALFEHRNQERHSVGWKRGLIEGKYGLTPKYRVLLDVPASIISKNVPFKYLSRAIGYYKGRLTNQ
jgi:hypothetical protein